MISTVTTTTVTTVAALGLSAAMSGAAVVVLLVFLLQRELASAAGPRFGPLARNVLVVITPLLVAFAMIVADRLATLSNAY
jgi:hypothetical protein